MLRSRQVPTVCRSCRLQILSLFELPSALTTSAPKLRYSTSARLRPRVPLSRSTSNLRSLSSTRKLLDSTVQDTQLENNATVPTIESVVRQARETFGDTLPKGYLSIEEYQLYERLYGPPLRETIAEDLEYVDDFEGLTSESLEEGPVKNVLLRETADGEFEEVEFHPELATVKEAQPETVQIQANNQREFEVISRLAEDLQAAIARPAEEEDIDEEFEEDEEDIDEDEIDEEEYDDHDLPISSDSIRTHPHTLNARMRTEPTTLSLPQEQLITPISELLARTNMKHLTDAAEKAFGGPGLPYSPSTPESKKLLPQKHIGLEAGQHRMSEVEADAYLAAVMPGTYAAIMSTLVEVRRRLGSSWLRDLMPRENGEAPRVLDAGGGGAGVIAWQQIVQAEWDILREEGVVEGHEAPSSKTTVLTGPATLRHRMSRFLENTTFLPRLPDYVHSAKPEAQLEGAPAQQRKSYDIIIAPHTLFPLKEDFRRKNAVQNLWSLLDPNGGVLIIIEKGLPRGFEAIAGARSLLLDNYISSPGSSTIEHETQATSTSTTRFAEKEEGMIIAPCTNHSKCPMYPVPGLSSGRKDFCHFRQRFIRPSYLQRVLGASSRNHEDVRYSYIAVRRGVDSRKAAADPLVQGDIATNRSFAGYEHEPEIENFEQADTLGDLKFNPLSLPRTILPPLKRRGHVTLDLCTPSGKLERWTVPKSFSTQAYRDARKSQWGDLWALGAKTRIPREPRLGRGHGIPGKTDLKGVRDGRQGKGGKKMKKNRFEIIMGEEGMEGIKEAASMSKFVRPERRTKGGRVWKEKKPIGEDDI
ncbi:mitochondrial small ribosomal subunit Rsm22-domain-containing protein [Xylogone sp. PMI_703]|nr:mitochondrial small ribosomal subunit Rsm22-domain-containing protein [Xylogone sp. PMI_703]